MNIPETHYATTEDGVSIAYQTVGNGPIDLVLELESFGNVEIMWELDALADLFGRLSAFSRLILHDKRGTGLSGGRGQPFPNLETRARDLLTVSWAAARTQRLSALTRCPEVVAARVEDGILQVRFKARAEAQA